MPSTMISSPAVPADETKHSQTKSGSRANYQQPHFTFLVYRLSLYTPTRLLPI
ncbi:hypothetical protein DL98DRAFT_510816 [Cadophora sp. DSE1049]|nr:hypothetical protein DL98DRAFT_510816 [Cadophora sp. DSE1049]